MPVRKNKKNKWIAWLACPYEYLGIYDSLLVAKEAVSLKLAARKQNKLTQAKVAKQLGVSQQWVSREIKRLNMDLMQFLKYKLNLMSKLCGEVAND
jgi:predicted DNA-binding protein YlxM (UPF0122 family)